jgi:RHS repeat-associated protein
LERTFGLGWSDYGARWYDASVGRWNAIDPLSENYNQWSPYNYVLNNPTKFIDPNGKDVYDPNGQWIRKNDRKNDNAAYVLYGDGTVMNLGISDKDFRKIAAVAYGETRTDESKKEKFGIVSTISNANAISKRKKNLVTTAEEISYADNGKNPRYNSFIATSRKAANKQQGKMDALAAVINALTGGIDYSNGATQWDGTDVLTGTENKDKDKSFDASKHYRQRTATNDSRKGIADPNNLAINFYYNVDDFFCGSRLMNSHVKNLTTNQNDAQIINPLWQVTGVETTTIFYKEIPIK